ncbi:unnamed protein product [Coffea canephora]|uniref:Protein LURP-one-related 17 n=2 Tax=Coffea TaxID=13442 RepID=A0A068UUY7_COFCA|nr:unnamed protein product [Coffea canephora]
MILFFKSASRSRTISVEDNPLDQRESKNNTANETCTSLTVWRKSLIFSCEGFTVFGSDGSLVYRVDSYTGRGRRPGQVILMDGSGKPILTISRRKKLGLVDSWLVYEGEVDEYCSNKKSVIEPIFCVRKSLNVLQPNFNVLAYVYRGGGMSDKRHSYVVEGSYAHRSCKVLDGSRRVVAEIKRKEATVGGVSFGLEVFLLIVQPGFDSGFAMALVLLLDQIFS